ncbi:hypothetical protein COW36_19555 [bacterium (Candidatus Blackallbacteria) CG17_big_fil_post_rev_8_21_14_2_50_48_46]|uniref:Bacterial type II secretion system protein E domain-containing protein n=1 Tax=bacterium (Candidatus Blackallbacteria) CG17_big_fil_post_rev_8_21_14_2_50_48_46 TaxID=2014261 RepID=A0A2M7FZR9_9BACT|nr:MAG: hypothetical protein COW64_15740 [bacterium (Candidatus Blackallbacteria) CG18_big_fil_WC_8_21_14_2_50_49_26]PIW14849.1 MAG: hypothetical protein COW36_19555 [bacterium (Candidatus Blackallbacteria) CG17_big_fil_post_rev_8_21_14_2_50_48_46]PIW44416.1 MAG: hypothetical protein COW20_24130 [bacterium (Candidatus Blackallbacteria) CG13_big_fil_rev_8_21_14_2_50_49_14]
MMPPLDEQELLSMEEAIERLKTTRPTFYRWLRTGRIKGMKVGRQWRFYPEDLERFLKGEGPRIDLPLDISPLLKQLSESVAQAGGELPDQTFSGMERAVELLIQLLLLKNASHLHLEPLVQTQGNLNGLIRFRIEGRLQPQLEIDRRLIAPMLAQFKLISGCDPHSQDSPQEGQFNHEAQYKPYHFKTHFLPSAQGETLTMTLLHPGQDIRLADLKLDSQVQSSLDQALKKGWGLVITSGPHGSGKTTTLYAILKEIASPELKTISLEDPVEQVFPWIVPVTVDHQAGETLTGKLRVILNADPDAIMIGELRDEEAVKMAMRIGLTGHLVLTQLHSETAIQALLKLSEISGSPYTVTESVRLILNQRLVRKLCPDCKKRKALTQTELKPFENLLAKLELSSQDLPKLHHATGCQKCQMTGYRGRMQITEALSMTPELQKLLHQHATADEIEKNLAPDKWHGFLKDGWNRVLSGETTLEELARVSGLT